MRAPTAAIPIAAVLAAVPATGASGSGGDTVAEAIVTQVLEQRARERERDARTQTLERDAERSREMALTRAREIERLIQEVSLEAGVRRFPDAAGGLDFDLAAGLAPSSEGEKATSVDESRPFAPWHDVLLGALQDEPDEPVDLAEHPELMSDAELARQISNPVGELWLLFNQHDITIRDLEDGGDNQILHNFKFQPVIPLALTDEWRLISRPVLQFNAFDIPQADGSFDTDVGFGDIVLFQLFSNSDPSEKWMTGFGPTWIFPTATQDTLGGDNWAVGPAALVLYLGDPGEFIAGGLVQHWWDFAGAGDQLNLTDFQPIVRYRMTETLNIGAAPNWRYDWANEDWSIPIGGGFDITTRIGDLPVRIGIEVYYNLDPPKGVEEEYGIRLFFVPVIPAPAWANDPLFGR